MLVSGIEDGPLPSPAGLESSGSVKENPDPKKKKKTHLLAKGKNENCVENQWMHLKTNLHKTTGEICGISIMKNGRNRRGGTGITQ